MLTKETGIQENGADHDPIVEVKGLCKSFNHIDILKGVDLTVKKGENLVVLGKSGSGKSVLIKCMVGLVEPDEGEIFVFGKDLSALTYKELNDTRIKIGFLFQNGALYDSMTVKENLAFPLRYHFKKLSREEIEQTITEALDSVGLKDAMDKMPSELSGGMLKRIGLARTLILHPDIMLYDEPTTGLDTATAKEISALILEMQKKKNISSIIITHDMTCAKTTADRIVMLKDGVIIAEGSYATLQNSDDEWIKSFFD
jgi:phospholipid/cholesterol/gamma-HCH transport system ATP-binding protein